MQPVLAEARKLPGVRVSMGQPGGLGRGGLQSPDRRRDRRARLRKPRRVVRPDARSSRKRTPGSRTSRATTRNASRRSACRSIATAPRISASRSRRVGRTLETVLGSRIVTTYIDRGREYNVILQGTRRDPRNDDGSHEHPRALDAHRRADSAVERRAARGDVGNDAARAVRPLARDQDLGRPRERLHDGRGRAVVPGHRRARAAAEATLDVGRPDARVHAHGPAALLHVPARARGRVPRARRAVRELRASHHHHGHRAARAARRRVRPEAVRPDDQHLQPDRRHHADRHRGQERRADRRVRESAARPRRSSSSTPSCKRPSRACGPC